MAEIAGAIVNGRHIAYRPGEVIAVGSVARDVVAATVGADFVQLGLVHDEPIDGMPETYLMRGDWDAPEVVAWARSRGLVVQLNHVLLAHGGCGCDPCCGSGSGGAHPYKANSVPQAHPYKANPDTSAEPVESSPGDIPAGEHDDQIPTARIWILDTGLPADLDGSTLASHAIDTAASDLVDELDADGNGRVDPVAGHGTFIAGIIKRLNPQCTITVEDVIEPDGDLDEATAFPAIHALLNVGDDVNARTVLNLSFGGGLDEPLGTCLAAAVRAAQQKGVVVVASAGNDASCAPVYPAAFPGVASVGAVDAAGLPAEFTNFGSWVRASALGVGIVSTFLRHDSATPVPPESNLDEFTSGWATWSGTSFAAPIVTAAIARRINTGLTASEALQTVLDEGEPIPCLGHRVDIDETTAGLTSLDDIIVTP